MSYVLEKYIKKLLNVKYKIKIGFKTNIEALILFLMDRKKPFTNHMCKYTHLASPLHLHMIFFLLTSLFYDLLILVTKNPTRVNIIYYGGWMYAEVGGHTLVHGALCLW